MSTLSAAPPGTHKNRAIPRELAVALAALSVGLVVFAVAAAPPWNEGLHLVAAQLIRAGKAPYVDFFYQHPPLYVYANAAWMGVFGESWRSVQALPALLTAGCVMLVAGYVHSRVEHPAWRTVSAVAAVLLVGLHPLVVRFGVIAQPYAFCLFLLVLAFRLDTAAASREGIWLPAGAGLCAGSAACSSLLAAPASPILLWWMLRHNRAGSRWYKAAAFMGGLLTALVPLLWLAARAPRQVWFDVVQYHLLYRRPENLPWFYVTHDLKVVAAWLVSPQSLLLIFLSGAGMLCTAGLDQKQEVRAEQRLCLWLAFVLAAPATLASPTFAGYFILVIPFLGLLAAMGSYAIGINRWTPRRPAWMLALLAVLMAAGLGKWFFEFRAIFDLSWARYERIAATLNRVTPPHGTVYAIPEVYFAARRLPPPGLENPFSSSLSPAVATAHNLVPASQIDNWLSAGRFDTVVMADSRKAEDLTLPRRYAKRDKVDGFEIFWQPIPVSLAEPRP